MTRRLALAGGVILATAGVAAPAAATSGAPVAFTAFTSFSTDPDGFTGSVPACTAGTVTDGPAQVRFLPGGGVYVGDKVFACAESDSGFVVRLKARFGDEGSTGTWVVVDGWGELEDTKGSGTLVGIPVDGGIDDVYTGTLR